MQLFFPFKNFVGTPIQTVINQPLDYGWKLVGSTYGVVVLRPGKELIDDLMLSNTTLNYNVLFLFTILIFAEEYNNSL